ncbi:MAG: hypothetical protein IT376_09175 [Polyangiaceae bacterium]|nr:hypothetical protein [Polyangiaceae bacterium]
MRRLATLGLLLAACAVTAPAHAGGSTAVALVPAVELDTATGLARDRAQSGQSTRRLLQLVDSVIREAAQDLGLDLDVSERREANAASLSEDGLIGEAAERWIVSPRIELMGDTLRLRIVAVAPGSRVLLVRSEELDPADLEVRAMIMLRDLVAEGSRRPGGSAGDDLEDDDRATARPTRSDGRAVLALSSAILGGYAGLSVERVGGGGDPRLVYPLVALGTGMGLGASMIVADEWNIGLGDAWYLAAGMWWPTASGLFLARGYDVRPTEDRYVYGLVGAVSGVTLATISIGVESASEGDAALAHSGGLYGGVLGALAELALTDEPGGSPARGLGWGTGLGVIASGALATQVEVSGSRVLLIDLSAMLGALTGAALASPLVFEEPDDAERRGFVGAVAGGAIVGGFAGWWWTRPERRAPRAEQARAQLVPWMGAAPTPWGAEPVVGLAGTW